MNNEQELLDLGYVLTNQVAHTGIGDGKVYAKSFDNVAPFDEKNVEGGKHYDYWQVDPNGVVSTFAAQASPVATPEVPVPPASTAFPDSAATASEPAVEPEATPATE